MARTKKVATEATETKVVETAPVVESKPTKKAAPKAKQATKVETVKTEKVEKPVTVSTKTALSSFEAIIRPLITEKSMKGI